MSLSFCTKVLTRALLRELETQFYIQGLAKFSHTDMQKAGLSAAQAQIVVETLTVIANDENQHAIALKAAIKALGGEVKQPCGFDFSAALSSPAGELKRGSDPANNHVLTWFIRVPSKCSWLLRKPSS